MKYSRKRNRYHVAPFIYFAIILVWITLRAFTDVFDDPRGAKRALLDANYHPIEVGGFKMLACSHGDLYTTKFTAYSPDSSRVVSGVVCKGLFKGSTIRTF